MHDCMTCQWILFDPQYDELENLGFKGFAAGFYQECSQIVGTSSTLQCFSPAVIEWLHALVTVGKNACLSVTVSAIRLHETPSRL